MIIFRRVFLCAATTLLLLSCTSVPKNATDQLSQESVQPKKIVLVKTDPAEPSDTKPEKQMITPPADIPDKTEKRNVAPASETKSVKDQEANNSKQNHNSTDRQPISEDLQEEQETLDQALELLNQSQGFWQKGDIDNSLRCLDEAYALILEVNGDPEIARQKDDLRVIISKRIVEISTSRYTVAKGMQSEIPMIMNADVEREIRSFQTVERGFFLRSYQRSGQFRPAILKYLEEAGLPKELSWLPLVESGFQCSALSTARALGLWQFIPSTGYKYALKRDNWVDERLNPEKSTMAAIAYLKELHGMFGDWLTCLAAYNCGEGRVLRVIAKQHLNYLDHFWDLYRQLPNETARYVPRFLATLHIIKDPKKYGMDLSEDLDKPIPYETVQVEKCMRLGDIAQALDISKEVITALNSELKLQITPEKSYVLRLPNGSAAKLSECIKDIPEWQPPRLTAGAEGAKLIKHKVRKGESLTGIARRYKTSVGTIMACNDLASKRVAPGQVLRVYVKYAKKADDKDKQKIKGKSKKKKGQTEEANNCPTEEPVKYKVKRGDSITSLAKRYGVKASEIRKLNNLKGNQLNVDQVIKIKDTKSE